MRLESHPIWVRGLKSERHRQVYVYPDVAPYMGAWIEIAWSKEQISVDVTSHPIWVRGLKSPAPHAHAGCCQVAPYMGAWIEITSGGGPGNIGRSRTLYGCVD